MALSGNKGEEVLSSFHSWAQTQIMVAHIASASWVSTILKCRDAVLTKVKVSIIFEVKMELGNVPVFGSSELLPPKLVTKAEEKLS